jgi:tellurite methyltransferase
VAPAEGAPSAFLMAELDRLCSSAPEGPVLDVACGRGRHAWPVAARGRRVVAADRDGEALAFVAAQARRRALPVSTLEVDLERSGNLPFRSGVFAGVLVFRFLFRPLAPALIAALRPGGVLLYETFTLAQRELPRGPRNPDFLLAPGELPRLFRGLEVIQHRELRVEEPWPQALAQLVARRPLR